MMGPLMIILIVFSAKAISLSNNDLSPARSLIGDVTIDTSEGASESDLGAQSTSTILMNFILADILIYLAFVYPDEVAKKVVGAVTDIATGKKGPLASATAKSLKKAAGSAYLGSRQKMAALDLNKQKR